MAVVESARLAPQMQGITLLVINNQATSIRSSLRDVGESGVLGGMFALIILYLFLRHWPTTLFVSLAVPLSLLITLAAMYFMNLSINVMTMMGMMLAIGMLVDNAVVVTESVFRHRQMNPSDPRGATLAGVREVGIATLAGTATSVVVFLPILFGERNQMTIFLTHVAHADRGRDDCFAGHCADTGTDADLAFSGAAAGRGWQLDPAPAGPLRRWTALVPGKESPPAAVVRRHGCCNRGVAGRLGQVAGQIPQGRHVPAGCRAPDRARLPDRWFTSDRAGSRRRGTDGELSREAARGTGN